MSEGKKAPKTANADAARPQNTTVGETLRASRIARGLELEDVSASIHIRAVQLRAIEEGDISALPGMTYAVGFVRSYANFLGLNGAEIVHKFKAEHGHSPSPSNLSFPEPVVESRMPDPIMIGVGAFLAVVVLIGWTFWSNMNSGSEVAEQIPPAPVEETIADATTPENAALLPGPDAAPGETAAAAPAMGAALTAATPAVSETPTPAAAAPAETPTAAATDTVAAAPATATPATEEALKKEETAKPEEAAKSDDETINIKKGKTRITLKANQASWIQVEDSHGKVLYRKVLRPGETYSVPDQPGLSLVTANAGGLDVIVDGNKAPSLGRSGEIVRGIALDPSGLKKKRAIFNN